MRGWQSCAGSERTTVTGQTWLIIGVSVLAVLGLGGFILTRTEWFRARRYALDVKRIFDKYKLQEKAAAVQSFGQNPNPVLVKKPLRELIGAYQGLIGDMEKIKASVKTKEIHEETLTMHRESLSLYQLAAVGGFRQKAMMDKQRRLQQMERGLQEKMEKLYGPMKKPK
jgi:hypothetical protein